MCQNLSSWYFNYYSIPYNAVSQVRTATHFSTRTIYAGGMRCVYFARSCVCADVRKPKVRINCLLEYNNFFGYKDLAQNR